MRAYDGYYLTIPQLVENGAALNTVITLAAESFSQLVASGKKWRELKLLAAVFSVVVIVVRIGLLRDALRTQSTESDLLRRLLRHAACLQRFLSNNLPSLSRG
jgi:hypothetical protein